MSHYAGTVTIATGIKAMADVSPAGISGVLIGNESGLTVVVTMQGANTSRSLYPGTVDWFPVPKGSAFNGKVIFEPTANLSNVSSWPSSFLQLDTFGPNEVPTGTYPVALPRNQNIGNTVNTALGGSNSLQNDNNAQGTQFVEATESGAPSSNVSMDNSGNFTVKQWVGGVLTTLFQVARNAATCMLLGATGKTVETVGSHKVDQTLTVVGTSSLDNGAIVTDGSGNIQFNGKLGKGAAGNILDIITVATELRVGATGGDIRFDSPAGTEVGRLTNAGIFKPHGNAIQATTGSNIVDGTGGTDTYINPVNGSTGLVRFATNATERGQFSLGNFILLNSTGITWATGDTILATHFFTGSTTGTYSHGAGGSPAWVAPVCSVAGSQTQGYDTITSTQVHITSGSGLAFKALCIRT